MSTRPLSIVLGVTGGIAAYKACLVLRLLTEAGHRVRVVPTAAALKMVGKPTFEALSGQPVHDGVFDDAAGVDHVKTGREADLVIVAPATASTLARAAAGLADDLLTATLLTATCPVLVAPAMHTEMWLHPATVANVETLRARGVHVLDPDSGRLTGKDTGPGRLPEPEAIVGAALALVNEPPPRATTQDLSGTSVVVTAGGTREAIDPVRFLGNRSSGNQGVALATAAAKRGAYVQLIAANVDTAILPDGVEIHRVESTADLQEAAHDVAASADVVIMAAAVSDFRPDETSTSKKKKSGDEGMVLTLVQNPDILRELVADRRPGQTIVGFAAETGEMEEVMRLGREKARRKGADLLAVNRVGNGYGFGDVDNSVHIVTASGELVAEGSGSKVQVADIILDAVTRLRNTATITE